MHRIFSTPFASVYPHYVTKAERKGRTKTEVDEVIGWLTGFDEAELGRHLAEETTVEDPLMRKIRYLDKLVDELAKGKAMEKVLRARSDAAGPR